MPFPSFSVGVFFCFSIRSLGRSVGLETSAWFTLPSAACTFIYFILALVFVSVFVLLVGGYTMWGGVCSVGFFLLTYMYILHTCIHCGAKYKVKIFSWGGLPGQ